MHGCGNVGAIVARLLVEHGAASVHTIDMAPSLEIAGCANVSEPQGELVGGELRRHRAVLVEWALHRPDRRRAPRGAIVGATNLPLPPAPTRRSPRSSAASSVPEGVSSAGAVIVDSIEHFRPQAFAAAEPEAMYEFTREVVREKVAALVLLAERLNVPPSLATPLITADRSETPIGMRFGSDGDGAAEAAAEAAAAASIAAVGRLEAAIPEAARPAVASHFDQIHSHVNLLQQHFAGGKSGSVDSRRAARALSTTSQRFGGGKRSFSTGVGRRRGLATPSAPAPAADVVIVGGGIMGLNIAYQLRRRDANFLAEHVHAVLQLRLLLHELRRRLRLQESRDPRQFGQLRLVLSHVLRGVSSHERRGHGEEHSGRGHGEEQRHCPGSRNSAGGTKSRRK